MTHISIDIEADGPVPGLYSMLSIGAVAFDEQGKEIAGFSCNLKRLPDAGQHPATMRWWQDQGDAYAEARIDMVDPCEAMRDFHLWLREVPTPLIFVGYPACFDWMWVAYYLHRFVGDNPFGFCGLDIESYAAGKLGVPYDDVYSETLKPWASRTEGMHHRAIDDARRQGELFVNLRKR